MMIMPNNANVMSFGTNIKIILFDTLLGGITTNFQRFFSKFFN